ncbi:prephenate dehydratase domain-containing protein [Pontibacter akesuensis]|uniref:prephenate dehydratase n=1 Tax=Pontibacter akesuensis TaxID=388950 RepID=A0A1I7KMC0_9BACT|nr:prephenate dehydratase domain-containing protein [Pontibacter akesuensis]GHA77636.1 prephenate dehydratase [Pontibacter akesuensis]SFU98555.1 prephenate dehydratase [Pontibacter akesuensis]
MNSIRIAIQGGPASFHDAAARQLHHDHLIETVPCTTFRSLSTALAGGAVDAAVMAIENTLAGSLLPNYSLLQEHHLHVTAEAWLPIDQNLMALPGQKLEDIRTVLSHPVALAQCSNFFLQHPHLQAQEAHDTADSAKAIQEQQLKGVAAIAGAAAAALYNLEVLEANVADSTNNFTRFLLLQREKTEIPATADKAILLFRKPLHTSTLTLLLSLLQKHQVEVKLLQTLPSTDARGFLVMELEAADLLQLQEAIAQVKPLVEKMQVLGPLQKAALPTTANTRQHKAILPTA